MVAEALSLRPTAPPASLPGYRLDRFLGSGTFGQVWYGHDLNTGRPVAIKFYLHRGGVNWSLLSREVKNLVQLSAQRSIVQVLDVGWDAEPPYYVMEYLANGSLEDVLREQGRLPVSQAVEIFRQICIGLNQCHGRGVLHCDLKPGNILLDSDNFPRLADFGQSRMSHDQSPSLGTLFYMAPEQADLDAVPDARWDVYALGVILYRMLTGRVPHRDPGLVNQIDTAGSLPQRLEHYRTAILGDARPREHRQRRGVDRALAAIVDHCLTPNPAHRFANVEQVLTALDQRQQVQDRRPLMLLGIVGPLLLMIASGGFAARSIVGASARATAALRTEARSSNELAARFAARSLESEMQRFFQILDREANNPLTAQMLGQMLATDELTAVRQSIAEQDDDWEMARAELLQHPIRRALDQQLRARLDFYGQQVGVGAPYVSTLFVTDAQGTIVSIAYDTEVEEDQLSTGLNFAFRTYFHGGTDDFASDTPAELLKPLRGPHLSGAFQSTATGLWKIAFSMPIHLDRDDQQGEGQSSRRGEPDGVFVVTTNLGDFESMRDGQLRDQLAVVIDARDGPLRGTVLQHPLMDLQRRGAAAPAGQRYQLPDEMLDQLLAGGDVDYLDPMAEAPGGDAYEGPWLAAVHPVSLPREWTAPPQQSDDSGQATTDLMLLVQYRLASVLQPVGELKRQLLLEGALTLTLLCSLAMIMWLFVNRLNDPTRFEDAGDVVPDPARDTTVAAK